MKTFTIPAQAASDECPAVPKTVRVKAPDMRLGILKLKKVLQEDPKLDKVHPELMEEQSEEDIRKSSKSKK